MRSGKVITTVLVAEETEEVVKASPRDGRILRFTRGAAAPATGPTERAPGSQGAAGALRALPRATGGGIMRCCRFHRANASGGLRCPEPPFRSGVPNRKLKGYVSFLYRVPNILSPASPSPGRIYPLSLRQRSRAAVTMETSGCADCMTSTPSGAATRQRNLMLRAPASLIR